MYPYYQTLNFQAKQIGTHLGESFISDALNAKNNSIILATECMSEQVAKLCRKNTMFKRFFNHIFNEEDIAKPDMMTRKLNNLRDNVRSEEAKEKYPNRLTTYNFYRYCKLNLIDYTYWGLAASGTLMGSI